MNRLPSTIFLIIYLLASTELHQLMRLPILVEHYLEHQQSNPGISLSDFIAMHYFSGDKTFADYTRDQQLPFKNNKCPEVTISMAMPPEELPVTTAQVFNLSPKITIHKYLMAFSSVHFSIWQPPRA